MKLKIYFSLLAGLFTSFILFSQSYEWGGRFGGAGEDVIKRMHVDANGNSYITGYFTDTADFDISNGEYNLTSNGFYDAFVQKTDAAGNLIWAASVGGAMFDYGTGINSDAQGNVYITGYFDETVDFDPGAGEWLLTSQGGGDIFILKLDSNGEFVWAKSVGGIDYEEATAIDVDEDGNVYVLGYLYGTVDFDPGLNEVLLGSEGLSDTFLLKLNSAGEYMNVYTYGGSGIDLALDMSIKSSDEIFLSGYFEATTDLDPRPNEEYIVTATEDFAGYVMQINGIGEITNVAVTEGGNVSVYAVAYDEADNMYITGNFNGTVNFDPASGNADYIFTSDIAYNGYVLKILANGTVAWARQLTSNQPIFGYDIAVASDGKVFSTGFFEGEVDFDPSATTTFLLNQESENPTDAYLLALNADGVFVSAYQFGGVGFIDTHQLGLDDNDNIYLAAQFETSVDINPLPNGTHEVSVVDFRDNYLLKMKEGALSTPSFQPNAIGLYPNPTTSQLFLIANTTLSGQNFVIYNALGQKVKEGTIDKDQLIQVDALKKGLYFIDITGGSGLKFIKE